MEFGSSLESVRRGARFAAGGVSSGFRVGSRPHPLVFEQAHGAELVDLDGNRFVDYVLGMGPMILGHSPLAVIRAVNEQLGRSILVAGQTRSEYEAAQLVVQLVPSAESVRFTSSGTEAVQLALRLARAYTGRSKVVKFEGHYHGWVDSVFVSTGVSFDGSREHPVSVAMSKGQILPAETVVLPWNDLTELSNRLGQGDVAAVIMEPVMFNSGGVFPQPGYLESVRHLCSVHGTLLIFDEIITGFRVGPGGAQGAFDVYPDLTVLGKAIANGFPVAAVAGKRECMELLADQSVIHGGTYNSQSVAMAATVATLTELATGAPYIQIEKVGKQLMDGLRELFNQHSVDATVTGFPGVFEVRLGTTAPRDVREYLACDIQGYADFAYEMLQREVRILPRGTWFLSSEHDDNYVSRTLEATSAILQEAKLGNRGMH